MKKRRNKKKRKKSDKKELKIESIDYKKKQTKKR